MHCLELPPMVEPAAVSRKGGKGPKAPPKDSSADATRVEEGTAAPTEKLSEDEQRYREVLSFLGDDIRSPVGVPRDYKPQDHSIHPLFRIDLGDYGGPLDLLVYLIRKHELDIFDIPIRFLTERYLEMLDALRALDIDVAAEFLVLAADLIHIKSKMLLPAKEGTPVDDDVEDTSDPRSDLVRRLLEYQKYRDAAVELNDRDQLGRDVFARNPPSLNDQAEQLDPGLKQISIFKLVELMAGMMKQTPARHEISYDNFNIAERMHFVLRFGHAQGGRFMLIDLMDEVESRAELVVTFIAVLESTKLQLVRLSIEEAVPPPAPNIWPEAEDADSDKPIEGERKVPTVDAATTASSSAAAGSPSAEESAASDGSPSAEESAASDGSPAVDRGESSVGDSSDDDIASKAKASAEGAARPKNLKDREASVMDATLASTAETEALLREVAAIEQEMAAQEAEEAALEARRSSSPDEDIPPPWEDEPLPTIWVELTGKKFEGDIMDDYA